MSVVIGKARSGQRVHAEHMTEYTLRASLSGTFLQTVAQVVTPLKGHSQSPCGCPPSSKLWHKWLRHSRDTLSLRAAVHLPPNCGTSGYTTQGTLSLSLRAAVHRRCQRPPKGLAPIRLWKQQRQSTHVNIRCAHPGYKKSPFRLKRLGGGDSSVVRAPDS